MAREGLWRAAAAASATRPSAWCRLLPPLGNPLRCSGRPPAGAVTPGAASPERSPMLVNARGRRRAGRVSCATGALVIADAVAAVAGAPGTAGASAPPSPIKHIVVLYLENHSFDSLL